MTYLVVRMEQGNDLGNAWLQKNAKDLITEMTLVPDVGERSDDDVDEYVLESDDVGELLKIATVLCDGIDGNATYCYLKENLEDEGIFLTDVNLETVVREAKEEIAKL